MKTIVILGAGQFGRACTPLLNTDYLHLIAYGDNNPELYGTFIHHTPVMSVHNAIAQDPDLVLIGVTDSRRSDALQRQALSCGFRGKFIFLHELKQLFDIRSGILRNLAERIHERHIDGCIAELGVYKGDFAVLLNLLFPDRTLYLFDTFKGFDAQDIAKEPDFSYSAASKNDFSDTNEASVICRLPYPDKVILRKGFFPDTSVGLENISYAFVSLDADLYAPTLAGLSYFYPRLSTGGILLLHDYKNRRFPGAHQAVNDYEQQYGSLLLVPLCDLHGSVIIIKP